jgi:hypothetical protein
MVEECRLTAFPAESPFTSLRECADTSRRDSGDANEPRSETRRIWAGWISVDGYAKKNDDDEWA